MKIRRKLAIGFSRLEKGNLNCFGVPERSPSPGKEPLGKRDHGVRPHPCRRLQLTNQIRREVTEAHARLASARQQLQQAQATVQSAENSLKRNFQRIRQGEGLPLEVLQSIRALDAALQERLNVRAAYNRAQFRLYRAIGWPAN